MFTGLVEGFTEVLVLNPSVNGLKLTLCKKDFLDDLKIGDSLAVNGVCLTIMEITDDVLCVELVPETLRVTTLSNLTLGQSVNVERALLAQGRIGGHFVLGHVDTQTSIIDICAEGDAKVVKFLAQQDFLPYLVPKGQIAIDGMSLTIMGVHEGYFTVSLIPHTQKITIVTGYQIGTEVNLEFDILAKYVLNNSTSIFNRYSENKDGYEFTEESLDSDGWVTRDRGPRQRRHEHGGDVTGQDPAS
jgi:riboflavin synthase